MVVKLGIKNKPLDSAQFKLFIEEVRPSLKGMGFRWEPAIKVWFRYVASVDVTNAKDRVQRFYTTCKLPMPDFLEKDISGDEEKKAVEKKEDEKKSEEKKEVDEVTKKAQEELGKTLAPFSGIIKDIVEKSEKDKAPETTQEKIIPKPEPPKRFFIKGRSGNLQVIDDKEAIVGKFELLTDEEKARQSMKNGDILISIELKDAWDRAYKLRGEFVFKAADITPFKREWKKKLARLKKKYLWDYIKPRLIKFKEELKQDMASKQVDGKWYYNGSITEGSSSCFYVRRKFRKFEDRILNCSEFVDFKTLDKILYIKYFSSYPMKVRSSWEHYPKAKQIVAARTMSDVTDEPKKKDKEERLKEIASRNADLDPSCWWKANILSSVWLQQQLSLDSDEEYANAYLGKLLVKLEDWKKLSYKIPEFKGKVMPHQVEAYNFAKSRGNSLLAMDVRTGKTLVSLLYGKNLLDEDEIDKILIFTNVTLKKIWYKEVAKWFGKKFRSDEVVMLDGMPQRRNRLWSSRKRIFIANYEQAKDPGAIRLGNKHRLLVIADECTYIKNIGAGRTKALFGIPAKYKVGLSGEPIEAAGALLKELHTMERWLDTKIFGSYEEFKRTYLRRIRSRYELERQMTDLNKYLLQTIMYRVTLAKVAPDMPKPEVIEVPIELKGDSLDDYNSIISVIEKLEDEYQKIVDEMRQLSAYSADYEVKLSELKEKKSKIKRNMLTYLKIAHRFCDHPKLLSKGYSISEWSKTAYQYFKEKKKSPKLEAVLNLINEKTGPKEKVVIFTEYAPMAEFIGEAVEKYLDRPTVVMTGQSPVPGERVNYLRHFEKSKRYNTLVMTDIGRYGLNLPFSNVGVIYDLPWNTTFIKQRIGRFLGMRKAEKTTIYIPYVVNLDLIEQRVRKKLNKKTYVISQVVDGAVEESYSKWLSGMG